MPKLIVPLDKSFTILIDSRHTERRVEDDDPIVVTFKQANEALNLRRQEMLARPITRMWEETQYREEFNLTPFGKRMAIDVWLTLTSCNIEGPDDKRLFSFSQLNGSNKITDKSIEDFLKKWGQLWPEWAEAIYVRCLEVNPSWGLGGEAENEDEDVLTLGEDDAGAPAIELTPDLAS
jgi:hypothetical protein